MVIIYLSRFEEECHRRTCAENEYVAVKKASGDLLRNDFGSRMVWSLVSSRL